MLPVGASTNHETVREHLQRTAERIEEELGEQRQPNVFEGREDVEQPLPNGPMKWSGGYVRADHKEGCFEVIAGRSVVAPPGRGRGSSTGKVLRIRADFRQETAAPVVGADEVTGHAGNQQVVFMSDGGEDGRRVQEYLHPNSEHRIDWFHITMRLTVLQQQTKALQVKRDEVAGGGIEADREYQAPVLARQCGRSAGSLGRPDDGPGSDQQGSASGKTSRPESPTSRPIFGTTRSSSRTLASGTGRAKGSARHLSSRRSIRS